jgi:hypothetical protein
LFSFGTEVVAYDFPEAARKCAFMVSKSMVKSATTRTHAPQVQILHAFTEGFERLTAFCSSLTSRLGGAVVHMALDSSFLSQEDPSHSYVIVESSTNLILTDTTCDVLQTVIKLVSTASKLLWITQADNRSTAINADHGVVTGLARNDRLENVGIDFITLDVQDPLSSENCDTILDLATKLAERQSNQHDDDTVLDNEYMFHDGKIHVPRLLHQPRLAEQMFKDPEQATEQRSFHRSRYPLKLHLEKPGLLNSLTFADDADALGH